MAGFGKGGVPPMPFQGGKGGSPSHSNVFIGNLSGDMTEVALKQAFAPFGMVESAHVMSRAGRTSGFVKLSDVQSAERAIVALNGASGWLVKFANADVGAGQKSWGKGSWGWSKGSWGWPKGGWWMPLLKDEPEKPEPPPSDNLYVKHLPSGITEGAVRDTFSKSGNVVELRVLRPEFALECAALVRMSSMEQAAHARQTLDGHFPEGATPPLIAKVQEKNGGQLDDHVYLKNVPTNTTEEKVTTLFSMYGTVKWCKVLRSAMGQWRMGPTSACLVQMGTPQEAEIAIQALNGNVVNLCDLVLPMKVRYAENKANAAAAGIPPTQLQPPPLR